MTTAMANFLGYTLCFNFDSFKVNFLGCRQKCTRLIPFRLYFAKCQNVLKREELDNSITFSLSSKLVPAMLKYILSRGNCLLANFLLCFSTFFLAKKCT